jgi:hypothetical protein
MTYFKDTLAKLTSALSFQEKGKFPSQLQQNPKWQYNVNTSSSGSQHMDQAKSVITFRSGKVIEKLIHVEMNIFNICKQSGDHNDLQEVDFTEKLVHDQFQTISSEIEIDESDDLQMVYFQEELKANSWRPKIKELPPRSIESIPSSV